MTDFTDKQLTEIYHDANLISEGKVAELTPKRVFTAMKAMISFEKHESPDQEGWDERAKRLEKLTGVANGGINKEAISINQLGVGEEPTEEDVEEILLKASSTGKRQVWFTRREAASAVRSAWNAKTLAGYQIRQIDSLDGPDEWKLCSKEDYHLRLNDDQYEVRKVYAL